ncbi:hypothetical protein L2E82_49195 [Cichorium intybus]|uniref:Uncharacterized protein n=1 Tax=Cichorium intybus TaxID=13427 RepID=A0ACB8YZ07_CICIN|nr:hypothetical protein L2E82_49195 [Cichorium intybus]
MTKWFRPQPKDPILAAAGAFDGTFKRVRVSTLSILFIFYMKIDKKGGLPRPGTSPRGSFRDFAHIGKGLTGREKFIFASTRTGKTQQAERVNPILQELMKA